MLQMFVFLEYIEREREREKVIFMRCAKISPDRIAFYLKWCTQHSHTNYTLNRFIMFSLYIPMWLLNDSDSCNDIGLDDEMKFGSGGRALNLSISLLLPPLFIECNVLIACGQPKVGSRGTGRKICCHLSGGITQSFWNGSLNSFIFFYGKKWTKKCGQFNGVMIFFGYKHFN